MESDAELARRLQAEFDEEAKNAVLQENKDAAFAQELASQSHDISDSEDEDAVSILEDQNVKKVISTQVHEVSDSEDEVVVKVKEDRIAKDVAVSHLESPSESESGDGIEIVEDQNVQKKFTGQSHELSDSDNDDDVINAEDQNVENIHVDADKEKESNLHEISETSLPNELNQNKEITTNASKLDKSSKKRPLCKFGEQCYRKNPWHLDEFYHPHLENDKAKNESTGVSASSHMLANPVKRQKTSLDSSSARPEMSGSASHSQSRTSDGSHSDHYKNKPFSTRLVGSAPFNIFLNKAFSAKGTHNDPLSLVFPDILNPKLGELTESVQLNFMIDLNFLMDNYKVSKVHEKPLLVMYGQMEGNPKHYKDVKCVKVNLPYQYGTHHTKMMLLKYSDGLRVVIHTANLVPDDWEEKTQGYWVSPVFPKLADNKSSIVDGESPTRFKRDLIEYLLSYKAPDLDKWCNILKMYDFSSCNMIFIGSSPGYHTGESLYRWGHMKVRKVMKQYATSWKSSMPIFAQCSSIGSLGSDNKWLSGELGMSLSGARQTSPMMKVIYPSESDVQNSSQGWMGGSCLPYGEQTHAKQEWLTRHLHLWKSEKRCRTRAMPHIKTYTRLNDNCSEAQFLILTSANLSKAAWGMLQKQNSQLFIRSYEAGILALPKYVTGDEKFILKSPWKTLGFSLPYDVPPTPYPSVAKPWLNSRKTVPDVFGQMYP